MKETDNFSAGGFFIFMILIIMGCVGAGYIDYQNDQKSVNKWRNMKKQEAVTLEHNCRLLSTAIDDALKINAYGRTSLNPLFKVISYEVRDDCFITIQNISERGKINRLIGYAKAKTTNDLTENFSFYREGILDFQDKGEIKIYSFSLEKQKFKEIKIYPSDITTTFEGLSYHGMVPNEFIY